MKARLEPLLPCRPRISGAREDPASGLEKPGAGFQLIVALTAVVLVPRNRTRLSPLRVQFPAQSLGALCYQRGHRQPHLVPVQPPQRTGSKSAKPPVQRATVWSVLPHLCHRPPQTDRGTILGGVRGAGRLDHRSRVTFIGCDLNG